MPSLYDVSAEAQNDLFEIWRRIADDSVALANRIESEFYELFASLGQMPGQGHTRKDLTKCRAVLKTVLPQFCCKRKLRVEPTQSNLSYFISEAFCQPGLVRERTHCDEAAPAAVMPQSRDSGPDASLATVCHPWY
jgi:plasmid stabilization system protein ParE